MVGQSIAIWLWGGFAVGNPTLNRFYSLHFLLPFIILGLVLLHLNLLHIQGSSNPLNLCSKSDRISFYPYFVQKDIVGIFLMVIIFICFITVSPNYLGHSDNYIPANCLSTPPKIVPEWYLLPFYAILRSIPNKVGGVVFMVLSILVLMCLPILYNSPFRCTLIKPMFQCIFHLFLLNFLLLSWLGAQAVESPYYLVGQLSTFTYFFLLLIMLPISC
jgi:quinol-cytochrome oxidoreductase complex cytochrome b subunit